MRIPLRSLLIFLLLSATEPAQSQTPGGIKGSLVDDKSKPVAGAYVVATPLGTAGGLTLTAISDASGAFAISNAKPATYQLCVQVPGTGYLDPCRWGQPTQAAVTAGQTVAVSLRVVTGSVLRVRVKDPSNKYLSSIRVPSPDLMVGVMTSTSMFYPLNLAAKTDSEHTFEAPIPLDGALRAVVYSGQLQLADEKGTPLVAGANQIAVQHASGKSNPDVILTVTGKR